MERKGQAAMEFLMTYGWAILAAIIAIAVLWFLIGNPAGLVGSKFTISDPFVAEGFSLSAAAGVQLEVRNGDSSEITVSSITITDVSNCVAGTTIGSMTMPAGNTEIFIITGCSGMTEDNNFRGSVKIIYTKGTSTLPQAATGRVSGKVLA